MTVLLTHERFLPEFGGGGEEIVFQTAVHLRERGARVRVLTTGDPGITEYRGIPTKRLPVSRYRINFAVGAISRAAAGFDLIHTFNYHACLPSWLAGRRIGKPVVCTVLGLFRDAWRDMRGPLLGRCFAAWERILVRIPYTRTLFLSEYSRGQGLAFGVRESRALVNTPGINPAFFAASAPKDGSVLFAGKFEDRKGIREVVAVARALPSIRFRLAGWGPEEPAIRSASLPNVELLGFLEAEELAQAYARASVFLFPSRAETLGLVIAEAMAAGCAIVSSVPLGYEGAVIRPGDPGSTARAVAGLLNDLGSATAMGRRNAERARCFTWERYTDSLLATYRQVMREAHA